MFLLKEAYFKITVDYKFREREKGETLRLKDSDSEVRFNELIQDCNRVILDELPAEFQKSYGIQIQPTIKSTREGSLVLIVSVAISIYVLISRYKNFRESLHLLKDDIKELLNKMLRNKYRNSLESHVDILLPERDIDYRNHNVRYIKSRPYVVESNYFWPFITSLILNLILFAGLAALVWNAVKKVYW